MLIFFLIVVLKLLAIFLDEMQVCKEGYWTLVEKIIFNAALIIDWHCAKAFIALKGLNQFCSYISFNDSFSLFKIRLGQGHEIDKDNFTDTSCISSGFLIML